MNNQKSKVYRRCNYRKDLFKIIYRDSSQHQLQKCQTEIETSPQPMMDITKLPNGQFKDTKYMHTNEEFFIQLGGKPRTQVSFRLKYKKNDRESPNKYKEHPFLTKITPFLNSQNQNSINSMRQSTTTSIRRSMTMITTLSSLPTQTSIPQKGLGFESSRQKLFRILCQK